MGWVVNATLRPLYPRERPGAHCIGGWVGLRVGLDGCGKSRLHWDSIPELPSPQQVVITTELFRLTKTLDVRKKIETLFVQARSQQGYSMV